MKHKVSTSTETKTVTQTINYVYEDDNRPAAPEKKTTLTFSREMKTDEVTKTTTQGTWTPSVGTFPEVVSPTVDGYTPDKAKVDAENVTADQADIKVIVKYKADKQNVTYTIIDDTTNTTLEGKKELTSGNSDTPLPNGTEAKYDSIVDAYLAQGYELVSKDQLPAKFDLDSSHDQNVVVHVKHKVSTSTETKTVTQTINYVYEDDNTPAAPEKKTTLTFTREVKTDEVTKDVTPGVWAPSTGTFPEVVSPTVDGYTPDKAKVDAENVTADQADIKVTVKYKADKQKVTYTIIDDTTNTTLEDKKELTSGNSDTPLPNGTEAKYDSIVAAYLAQGYELVSKDQLPAKFDLDSSYDQNVVVHVKHKVSTSTETKTVTQTINYVYEDDNTPAAPEKKTTLTFTREVKTDEVTKDVTPGVWAPSTGIFPEVVSPVVDGYTPDKVKVDAENVTADQADIKVTVKYKADKQKVTYTIIDDTTNTTLEDKKELTSGNSDTPLPNGTEAKYDSIVDAYLAQGYELVSKDQLPAKFDLDSSHDQNVVVHVKHKVSTSTETKTVTQTINYVYEDDNTPAAPEKKTTLTFTREVKTDEVTKDVTPGVWAPSTGTFPEVVSPTVDGYTPDKAKVDAENVTADQADIKVTVKYKADKQKVTYTIIDDTTNTTLEDKKELTSGNSDTPLPNGTEAKYDSIVAAYLAQGYELVSKDQLPAKFDLDSSYDQNVVIRLKHKTVSVEETKQVTMTVRYHGAGGQTPADKVQTATWTRTVTTDKVTGSVVSTTDWTSDKANYDAVPSPVIPGYTVDVATVPSEVVTQENIVKDVHYTAQNTAQTQKVTYTVVDETTGQTLENQVELTTGESGATLPAAAKTKYDTVVAGYLTQGYEVVAKDELPAQFDTDSSVDQNIVIRLKHKTVSVEETKQVTMTVRYHGAGGQTPADKVQTATWTRTVTTDKVTGSVVSTTDWTSDKANYDAVPSPVIPGYTVDVATVPSEVVTQENIVKDVHYTAQNTAQTQKVTYTVVDETTGQTLENQVELTTGESGATLPAAAKTKYDTVVAGYLTQGYEVVAKDELPAQFDTDSSVDQNIVIRLKHKTVSVEETKQVTMTVRYHGAGGQTPADKVQTATWTRTVTTDKVTGSVVSTTDWRSDKANYDAVPSPVIPGYTVDVAIVPSEVVTQENIVKDVHYTTVPVAPEVPNTPDTPVKPGAPTTPFTPEHPAHTLPRTGESQVGSSLVTLTGLGLLLSVLGLAGRQKKEDE